MKNFSLGPVEMFPSTLQISGQPIPYFRTPDFSQLMLETDTLFKQCLKAGKDSNIIYLTASGTAAMEATVFNCFSKKDSLLIVDGGIFGHRFVQICEKFAIPHDVVTLAFGEVLTIDKITPYLGSSYTAFIVNIHETSTGQLYDISLISNLCKEYGWYLVIDAISSFVADRYDMEVFGADATIVSSQKGLALSPGMSFVALSDRLYNDRVKEISPPSLYFDFKEYVHNFERGQTPYTPAVRIAYELNETLCRLVAEGIDERIRIINIIAEDFRKKLSMVESIVLPNYPLSNASTPLLFKQENGLAVYEYLRTERNICLTPCGGDLKNKMLRVGHIGNHTLEENDLLIEELSLAVAKFKGR